MDNWHLTDRCQGVRIYRRPRRHRAGAEDRVIHSEQHGAMLKRAVSSKDAIALGVLRKDLAARGNVGRGANAETWGWFAERDDIVHGLGGARLRLQHKQLLGLGLVNEACNTTACRRAEPHSHRDMHTDLFVSSH